MAAVLFASPAAASLATSAATVADNGDAFVRNAYVQAGAKPNGTFGTSGTVTGTPSEFGFVSLATSGDEGLLGLINDPGRDGFGVGIDHGDFFVPGSPYEAWGLFAGGQLLENSDGNTDIPGAFEAVGDAVTNAVTWSSTDPANGIEITQTYTAPLDNSHLIKIDVQLSNTTDQPQTVYYIRQVDPDNSHDNMVRDAVYPWDEYTTFNSVLAQSTSSQLVVGYSYYENSVIGFQASDANAVVRISDWSMPLSEDEVTDAASAAAMFTSYRTQYQVGYRDFEDSTIDIIIKREIAAGATASLTFDYVLDPRALSTPHPASALDLNLGLEIGSPYGDIPAALSGGGLKPSSTYTLTEYSTPVVIFTGTTLPNGNFYDSTALPTDCRPGSHTLVLTGTAPDGTTVSDLVTYTVDAGCIVTAFDPFAAANGAPNPESGLAATGLDSAVAAVLASVAVALLGLGATGAMWSRRRGASA